MKGSKKQSIEDIKLAEVLLKRLKEELLNVETYKDDEIRCAYNNEYSLEKIKRHCTEIRGLLLEIKQNCTERYIEND